MKIGKKINAEEQIRLEEQKKEEETKHLYTKFLPVTYQ